MRPARYPLVRANYTDQKRRMPIDHAAATYRYRRILAIRAVQLSAALECACRSSGRPSVIDIFVPREEEQRVHVGASRCGKRESRRYNIYFYTRRQRIDLRFIFFADHFPALVTTIGDDTRRLAVEASSPYPLQKWFLDFCETSYAANANRFEGRARDEVERSLSEMRTSMSREFTLLFRFFFLPQASNVAQ